MSGPCCFWSLMSGNRSTRGYSFLPDRGETLRWPPVCRRLEKPIHDDSTPSLVVTPSKNLWHCFGRGLGGGPVDWAMKANGVSFRHAVELLREGIPSLAAQAGQKTTLRVLEAPVSADADDAGLLVQMAWALLCGRCACAGRRFF
nr:CHC2 zinc finger domain-containing protein [Burkholderia cepacia]